MRKTGAVRSIIVLLLAGFSVSVAAVSLLSGAATVEPYQLNSGILTIKTGEFLHADKIISLQNANPGDCINRNVTVRLAGTNKAYVRALITETWSNYYTREGLFYPGPTVYTPSNAPQIQWYLDDEPVQWPFNGEWQYHNGYWYYAGLFDPDQLEGIAEYRIVTRVCLEDNASSQPYRGASWSLSIALEAIQAADDAVFAATSWGAGYIEDEDSGARGWYPVVRDSEGNWQLTAGQKNFIWMKTNPGEANYSGWSLQSQP
jgi:hypothetical protein